MFEKHSGSASGARLAKLTASLLCLAALAWPAAATANARQGFVRGFAKISGSALRTSDISTGVLDRASMSVELVLAPSHRAELQTLLGALYDPHSASYRHWLKPGEFALRFAPSPAERTALIRYLKARGLTLQRSSSPFFIRATGSSALVSTAFRTSLRTYRDHRGITYFANASAAQLPARLAGGVLAVVGLANTVRPESQIVRDNVHFMGRGHSSPTNCETPYPTIAELYDYFVNGTEFPYGYGAAPGCTGLTPSQTNSIYGAPNVGAAGQGQGVTLAVFELSAYRESDVDTWARTFYGPFYNPPIQNVEIDGGPLDPICPGGDACQPASQAYFGDIEVDADIEQSLAIAPDARRMLVYNAPADETGQTELDEYSAIADQDRADTLSSGWGLCETDAGAGYAEAENLVFTQMASQGQSVFAASGDTGAFGCIADGTGNSVDADDPGAQPWVTGVGATSLENYNPGQNERPAYPASGTETVWNNYNLCNTSADEDGLSGLTWCADTGAGGGGPSQFWGRPSYQRGPGVNSSYETYGNGSTQCSLARPGTPCREVPDISANGDPNTPYAEYCTGSAATPGSVCATIPPTPAASGWFGVGGTSLSSPLLAGIFADRDGYTGRRTGNANPFLYSLFDGSDPGRYFHDITGIGQAENNNGFFPVTPGYDMATGVGTPIMSALITGS